MFIDREKELQQLLSCLGKPAKHTVMLYGRRRVGKSTLILEAVKNFPGKIIYYECLMTSLEENLKSLENKVKACYNNKFLHYWFWRAVWILRNAKRKGYYNYRWI